MSTSVVAEDGEDYYLGHITRTRSSFAYLSFFFFNHIAPDLYAYLWRIDDRRSKGVPVVDRRRNQSEDCATVRLFPLNPLCFKRGYEVFYSEHDTQRFLH